MDERGAVACDDVLIAALDRPIRSAVSSSVRCSSFWGRRTSRYWTPGGWQTGVYVHLALDASSGDLFFLQNMAGTNARDGSVRRLHGNRSSYVESTVTSTGTVTLDLTVGADGYLYSFDADDGSSSRDTIFRIDPTGPDAIYPCVYLSVVVKSK